MAPILRLTQLLGDTKRQERRLLAYLRPREMEADALPTLLARPEPILSIEGHNPKLSLAMVAVTYAGYQVRFVGDQPWDWIVATDNSLQLERWQQGKEILDVLNAALLAATATQDTTPSPVMPRLLSEASLRKSRPCRVDPRFSSLQRRHVI